MESTHDVAAWELLPSTIVTRVRGLALLFGAICLFAATAAQADILVLRGADGRILITNTGHKSGYKLISRHREFSGSSGMGLWFRENPEAAKYDDMVRGVSEQFSLDRWLVKAVIRAESNFYPQATSPKGAMGLMQLMPDTARMHEVKNAYDPVQNVLGGVRHLRYLFDRYAGNLDLILAAYNAGTKPVDAVRGIPSYPETQEYVRRVRLFHSTYSASAEKEKQQAVAAKLSEQLAKLDLEKRPLSELYGVPIVLHDRR
jgi:hypothetical protein